MGVKDIIDTADLPTGMGSPIYAGWQPKADAAIVARLRALGAVPLAKTTTSPFASHDPTATVNPRDSRHTPGAPRPARPPPSPPGWCPWPSAPRPEAP